MSDMTKENLDMMRKALAFYADPVSWQRLTMGVQKHMSMAFEDAGMRARVALQLEEASSHDQD